MIFDLLLALYRYTLYNLGMSQPLQLFRLQQVDTQLDQVRARLSEIEAALEDDSALRQAENKVASNEEARENAQRELDRAEEEVQAQQSKIDSNQKTFNEFGSMLGQEEQARVRRILSDAKEALEKGTASECTEALEKIAEMGRILSEVILYDPGSFGSGSTESEPVEEG